MNGELDLAMTALPLEEGCGLVPRTNTWCDQQAGVGIAVLPEPICQRLDRQTLRWLPLQSDLSWQLGMFWREGVYLSQSARTRQSGCESFWLEKGAAS